LDSVTATPTDRQAAICEAVFELLGEVGYDRMSMDAIAARAHASKATIYRSWPNKPDMVMAAVVHRYGREAEAPNTGSLRGDLIAQMTVACAVANSADGAIVTGLLTAATRNAELSQTLHRCLYEMKHAMYEVIVARAIDRGELTAGTDTGLLHEIVHSMVLARRLWGVGPLDDAFATRIVDQVLLPVLHQGA